MDFNLTLAGKDTWLAKMQKVIDTLGPALEDTMRKEMIRIADYVRANKLSGQVLNRRSGDLSRSITGNATRSGAAITGMVGSYGVPYAGVHEFGATFTRTVKMAWGRPLKQPIQVVFHYPERAFIRPSLTENRDHVDAALRKRAIEVLRGS